VRRTRRPPPRRPAAVLAVSGPSGSGKTRLLSRLIPALVSRGLSVAAVKHTRHHHALDSPGKDTELLRRAGAAAVAITGPSGTAWFGPEVETARALARRMGHVDLVLAEGFRTEPLPRIEVHRRSVPGEFLCATDRRVIAVVSDEPPPRDLPRLDPEDVAGVAALVVRWLRARRR